ncbi:hypothetical protein TNCV_3459081 [Trichonephila clavipes]|nr:hypothetical protein TNCV_3459081 [Trichonephila clavipes]
MERSYLFSGSLVARTYDVSNKNVDSTDFTSSQIYSLWIAWCKDHRTPDQKSWVRCHQIPSYTRCTCSLNQWVLKSCGLNHEYRGLENISLLSSPNAKVWRWEIGGVTIYRPFGKSLRANSYCHLYGAQGLGQRQAYF